MNTPLSKSYSMFYLPLTESFVNSYPVAKRLAIFEDLAKRCDSNSSDRHALSKLFTELMFNASDDDIYDFLADPHIFEEYVTVHRIYPYRGLIVGNNACIKTRESVFELFKYYLKFDNIIFMVEDGRFTFEDERIKAILNL